MSASAEGCKQPRCLPSLLASRNNDPFLLRKVERIAHDAHKYMQSLLNAPLPNCTKKELPSGHYEQIHFLHLFKVKMCK